MDGSEVTPGEDGIRFIRDVAMSDDFFGTHEPVAKAIAEVIQTNEDIKVIGLLGPWGSGKSTVVSILKKQLNHDGNASARVFTYDAWLHQSDPPRRSFLESLLHFLVQEGLTEEDDWSEKLDVLNRRVEDTVTTTTPRLTFPGTIMVLSLLLIPLGAKYANLEWYRAAFTKPQVSGANWIFYFGLACFIAPAIVAAGFYLAWRPTLNLFSDRFWRRANWTRHKKPHQDESILSFFMNRETKTNYNKIIKEPEPTAMEFQDAFREAMEIVDNSNARLIIVVDNLDRLPETEAIAMWATIRSFFLGGDQGLRSRKNRHEPVVILPIAEDAIQRIYGDADKSLAKSFIEKTFDLTFFVNRPVLTKWTEFLHHQMAHVFRENMDESWPFITGRFYERYSAWSGMSTITPRSINTLINAIATRWLQWKSIISFETVSYYCTFREAIERDIVAACASPLAPIGEYDPGWQNSIAAMYYGVNPEAAAEVLLDQPLKKAIMDGDEANFGSMSALPGFQLVLHKVIEGFNSEPHFDPKVLFNAVALMGDAGSDSALPEAARQTWLLLRGAMARLSPITSFSDKESAALLSLLKSAPDSKKVAFLGVAQKVLQGISDEVAKSSNFATSFVNFLTGAAELVGGTDKLPSQIIVPGDTSVFADIAVKCQETKALSKRLKTAASDVDIGKYVSDVVSKTTSPSISDGLVTALANTGRAIDWSKNIESIAAVIRAPLTNPASLGTALLVLGRHMAQVGAAASTVAGLGADLANRLNEAYGQKHDLVTARSVVLLIYIGQPFAVPDSNGWTDLLSKNASLFDEIDRCITLFGGEKDSPFTRLVSAQKIAPSLRDLAINIAGRRVREHNIGPRVSIKDAIDNLPAYQDLLLTDDLKQSFIVELTKYQTFWDVLSARPLDGYAGDVYSALLSSENIAVKAGESLRARLTNEPSDAWETAIVNGGKILDLATKLKQYLGEGFELEHTYSVLDKVTAKLFEGGDVEVTRRWFEASSLLGMDARITLFKNLRDRINAGVSSDILATLIRFGGRPLFIDGTFSDKPDDAVRHVILPLLVDEANVKVLDQIKDIAGNWIEECEESTRKVVAKQVGSLQSSDSDFAKSLQDSWGEAIGTVGEGDFEDREVKAP